MINFHPNNQQLALFAEGNLSPAEALIVSAHCDMCEHCQRIVQFHTESVAEDLFADDADGSIDFDSMMSEITNIHVEPNQPAKSYSKIIELDGKEFVLPRSLNRLSSKMGNWSHLVGKIWQAPVDIGGVNVANFIYMEKGGSVPEHTHRGSETTLVINGEFSDGIADYDSGDFIQLNGNHTHTPFTQAQEGCLVFSIVDKPLYFTSGWARLINPFSHLFFK
ncbi:ChrR family anti-sigma-E factor [Glaciecola sp. KUL10]|uniref:ChrR family anti-sigma-E factor n=1 Tax=Glaciecola sp. (strain KUL10) TaxID=2161813 RepID=UPI000D784C13|nr:ChrR family anti-sigma-E factor [Glaciecola sp. KUL10]GBL04640.1 transcription negative regulator ChrR [Glaciecola sp. KUL10]